MRAGLLLLGGSDFRAEFGLGLANVLALAAEGGIASLAGVSLGRESATMSDAIGGVCLSA